MSILSNIKISCNIFCFIAKSKILDQKNAYGFCLKVFTFLASIKTTIPNNSKGQIVLSIDKQLLGIIETTKEFSIYIYCCFNLYNCPKGCISVNFCKVLLQNINLVTNCKLTRVILSTKLFPSVYDFSPRHPVTPSRCPKIFLSNPAPM